MLGGDGPDVVLYTATSQPLDRNGKDKKNLKNNKTNEEQGLTGMMRLGWFEHGI